MRISFSNALPLVLSKLKLLGSVLVLWNDYCVFSCNRKVICIGSLSLRVWLRCLLFLVETVLEFSLGNLFYYECGRWVRKLRLSSIGWGFNFLFWQFHRWLWRWGVFGFHKELLGFGLFDQGIRFMCYWFWVAEIQMLFMGSFQRFSLVSRMILVQEILKCSDSSFNLFLK